MRMAAYGTPGFAGVRATAWMSSMPSISVSLTIRLLRCGRSASLTRSAVQSVHVSPPSSVFMMPPTSRQAQIVSGRAGSAASRITRHANPIFTRSGRIAFGSRRHVSPPSSLRNTPTGEVPA